jgi:hypothetical protein
VNIGEATDVNVLLDYLYAPPPGSYRNPRQQPNRAEAKLAAARLAERSMHALGAGWSADEVGASIPRDVLAKVDVQRMVDRRFQRPAGEREE